MSTVNDLVSVIENNNKTKSSVSTDTLREQIVVALNGDGVDAISLNASSANEAEIEAKAKGCAYILYTDISSLKAATTGKKLAACLAARPVLARAIRARVKRVWTFV